MSGNMGGVDSSIALQAKPPPQANPLQQIGEFANTQNALNQNKMFPGQLALQGQQVQGGAVSLAQHINQATAGAMTPLLAKAAGSITHADVTNQLAIAEANHIPTGNLVGALSLFPQGDGPQFDNAVRTWTASQAQPVPNAVSAIAPGQVMISNGQENRPYNVTPPGMPGQGSITPAGGGVPQYPPTSQLMGQVSWQDAQGTTHYGTAAEYATARGIPGAALGPAIAAPPTARGGMGTGHYPAPGLSNTAGPTPGVTESGVAQVPGAQAVADRVSHFQSDMFPLQQAQTALAKAPTGLGSEAAHTASSYLNTFAPAAIQKALSFISPIMTPEETTAYDETKKYLTQGQLGTPGATRSNEGLNTAGAASPSTQITKEAAQLVLKGMIGLRRMEQDEGQSWLNSGLAPSQFNQFRAQFQKTVDPRVYTFDQLTPTQRRQAVASSGNPGAFMAAVERAEKNGVLSASGGQ